MEREKGGNGWEGRRKGRDKSLSKGNIDNSRGPLASEDDTHCEMSTESKSSDEKGRRPVGRKMVQVPVDDVGMGVDPNPMRGGIVGAHRVVGKRESGCPKPR